MSVTRLTQLEDVRLLREDWNRLADENPAMTIFQRCEWSEAWWQARGQGKELFVLAVQDDDGRLIGVAPLFRHQRRQGWRKVRELAILGDADSNFCQCVWRTGREEDVLQALLAYLGAHRREWDLLRMSEMPAASGSIWRSALARGAWSFQARAAGKILRLPLRPYWDNYWESLDKNTRGKFQRQQHLPGDWRLETYTGVEITQQVIEDLAEISRLGAREKREGSLWDEESYRRFHWDYLFHGPLRSCFSVCLLRIGSQPAAYLYGFRYRKMFMEYNADAVEMFHRASPGFYRDLSYIRQAFGTDLEALDFTREDDPFQHDLRMTVHQNYEVMAFSGRLEKYVQLSIQAVLEPARSLYVRFGLTVMQKLSAAKERLAQVRAYIRKNGWKRFSGTAWGFLRRKIYINADSYILAVSPREIKLTEIVRRLLRDFEVRELTLKDYALLEARVGRENMSEIIKRFWEGDRCWGVLHENRLIGQEWTSGQDQVDQEAEIKINVPPGTIYFYDGFIEHKFRSRGVGILILNCIFRDPQVMASQRLITLVACSNRASLKSVQRFNFEICERIKRFKFMGLLNFQINTPVKSINCPKPGVEREALSPTQAGKPSVKN